MRLAMFKLHLTHTLVGIVLAHTIFALPYAIYILSGVFDILKDDYENCAANLGASKFQTLCFVTIPLLSPALSVSFILSFTISIAQYISTFIIGGGKFITLTMILIPYIQNGQIQIASIYSLLIVISSIIILGIIEWALKKQYRRVKWLR
jgi:putative spermidine/putrescine transport system permease protein